jgi:hypothetical protein
MNPQKTDSREPGRAERCDPPPSSAPEDDPNPRGGCADIPDHDVGKIQEAQEESFPASDPPCYTPAGYVDHPPSNP